MQKESKNWQITSKLVPIICYPEKWTHTLRTPNFFRVDVSDLTDSEKEEFEQEMQAMSDFIAERIRIRKAQKD